MIVRESSACPTETAISYGPARATTCRTSPRCTQRAWSHAIAPGEPMHLWVLEGNTAARGFYRAQGGVEADRRIEQRGGMEIVALRCVWG